MKANYSVSDKVDSVLTHITHLLSTNSTIGRAGLETWENLTNSLENKTWTEIAQDTFNAINETVQEGRDFIDTL